MDDDIFFDIADHEAEKLIFQNEHLNREDKFSKYISFNS
jgi:hypothetical protein